jgi:hypothetical protein
MLSIFPYVPKTNYPEGKNTEKHEFSISQANGLRKTQNYPWFIHIITSIFRFVWQRIKGFLRHCICKVNKQTQKTRSQTQIQ